MGHDRMQIANQDNKAEEARGCANWPQMGQALMGFILVRHRVIVDKGCTSLLSILQDEATDGEAEHAEDPAGLQKKESRLASFSWASRLSGASSSGASLAHPGLLQSLTGTIAGTHPFHTSLQCHVLHRLICAQFPASACWNSQPYSCRHGVQGCEYNVKVSTQEESPAIPAPAHCWGCSETGSRAHLRQPPYSQYEAAT